LRGQGVDRNQALSTCVRKKCSKLSALRTAVLSLSWRSALHRATVGLPSCPHLACMTMHLPRWRAVKRNLAVSPRKSTGQRLHSSSLTKSSTQSMFEQSIAATFLSKTYPLHFSCSRGGNSKTNCLVHDPRARGEFWRRAVKLIESMQALIMYTAPGVWSVTRT
jgi:hypothetical protein